MTNQPTDEEIRVMAELVADRTLLATDIRNRAADMLLAWLAERQQLDGYKMVPEDIHPLERTDCEAVIELLRNPPTPTDAEDETDYYAHWWQKLISAAPKP